MIDKFNKNFCFLHNVLQIVLPATFDTFVGIVCCKLASFVIVHIVPLISHCIATWYAVFWYLVKLTELETRCGRGDTVTY